MSGFLLRTSGQPSFKAAARWESIVFQIINTNEVAKMERTENIFAGFIFKYFHLWTLDNL